MAQHPLYAFRTTESQPDATQYRCGLSFIDKTRGRSADPVAIFVSTIVMANMAVRTRKMAQRFSATRANRQALSSTADEANFVE